MSTGFGYPNQPKVVYNGVTLLFTRPARPWVPVSQGVGAGREVSASGVPSVWVTRRESRLSLPLRFHESEWPAVRAWLTWALDTGSSFTLWPDQDAAASYPVYLEKPAPDDELKPVRGDAIGEMELTVEVRTTTGAVIEPAYYG